MRIIIIVLHNDFVNIYTFEKVFEFACGLRKIPPLFRKNKIKEKFLKNFKKTLDFLSWMFYNMMYDFGGCSLNYAQTSKNRRYLLSEA